MNSYNEMRLIITNKFDGIRHLIAIVDLSVELTNYRDDE